MLVLETCSSAGPALKIFFIIGCMLGKGRALRQKHKNPLSFQKSGTDCTLHISVQMHYRIVPAHLGHPVAGGIMTPVAGAGIHHSGASSCLLYPSLCPRCALKYCGSKADPR